MPFLKNSGMLWERQMSKVNDAYREVLRRELRWLPDLLPAETETFKTCLIDLDTLSIRPDGIRFLYDDSYTKVGSIRLLNDEGEILGQVGENDVVGSRRKWSWYVLGFARAECTTHVQFPEIVEEALKRLSPASDKTRYILELSSACRGDKATLHKLPRSAVDMATWLRDKSTKATIELIRFLES